MQVFLFCAELLCPSCGQAARLKCWPDMPEGFDPENESSYDSDEFPKGPFTNGGGEADTPQHCGACGLFLDNPLTPDGVTYVLNAIKAFDMEGRGKAEIINLWRDQYAGVLWSEATGWNASEQNNKA